MIVKFNLQLCRTVKNPKQGMLHRVVSYLQVNYHGTYAHEAMIRARRDYPGWAITDWKIEP